MRWYRHIAPREYQIVGVPDRDDGTEWVFGTHGGLLKPINPRRFMWTHDMVSRFVADRLWYEVDPPPEYDAVWVAFSALEGDH